jgi:hypothetical protein
MRRRREISLLLSPFLVSALIREAYSRHVLDKAR